MVSNTPHQDHSGLNHPVLQSQPFLSSMIIVSSTSSIPLPLQLLLVVLAFVGMLIAAGVVLWLLWHPNEVGDRLSIPASGGLPSRLFLGIILPAFPLLYAVKAFGQRSILWWDWRMREFHEYTETQASALAIVCVGTALLLFFHFFCSPIREFLSFAALGKVVSLIAIVGGVIAFLILEGLFGY